MLYVNHILYVSYFSLVDVHLEQDTLRLILIEMRVATWPSIGWSISQK